MAETTVFYDRPDWGGMTEELAVCAAAYFRSIGKDVSTADEFTMGASLDLKWMSPSDAKLLLSALTRAGFVTQRDGFVRPAADPGSVDVPLAYRPSKELLESLHSKSQTSEKAPKAEPSGQTEDMFPKLMDVAVSNGMQRRDFIQSCNKIQKRLDIEVAVAALIVLRDAGVDVSPYLDDVYGSLRA